MTNYTNFINYLLKTPTHELFCNHYHIISRLPKPAKISLARCLNSFPPLPVFKKQALEQIINHIENLVFKSNNSVLIHDYLIDRLEVELTPSTKTDDLYRLLQDICIIDDTTSPDFYERLLQTPEETPLENFFKVRQYGKYILGYWMKTQI